MLRNIVRIDEEKCDGCGLCARACAEGAIEIVAGKARLVSESYCDGLGACLGECPRGAITIERRPASPFDEEAARRHQEAQRAKPAELPCGCPGTMARQLRPREQDEPAQGEPPGTSRSELTHWPVQLRLVPPNAPYLRGADLLIAADCVPFALSDFHGRFLRGRCVVVGCPKLDDAEFYVQKLAEIFKVASPVSATVIRMEVPCCGGLVRIAREALARSGKEIPLEEVTVSLGGEVLDASLAGAGET